MDPSKTLEELNVQAKDIIFLFRRCPAHVCREWAATGACSKGRRCYQKGTHAVEFSPRYIEHYEKGENKGKSDARQGKGCCNLFSQTSASLTCSSQTAAPASLSPHTTPLLNTTGPRLVATPPAVARSPQTGSPRPLYGVLGRAVRLVSSPILVSELSTTQMASVGQSVSQAHIGSIDWQSISHREPSHRTNPNPNQTKASNSGEWDGLISEIASITSADEVIAVDTKSDVAEELDADCGCDLSFMRFSFEKV